MVETCQSNGGALQGFGTNAFHGNVLVGSNFVIGGSATSLTAYIRGTGSNTGTIYARVYNSSDTLVHTWDSINANTLTATTDPYVFTGDAYTLSANDRVGIEMDNITGTIQDDAVTSAQSGWEPIERNSGSWSTPSHIAAFKMCITYTLPPSEGSTRLPPPPLIARF